MLCYGRSCSRELLCCGGYLGCSFHLRFLGLRCCCWKFGFLWCFFRGLLLIGFILLGLLRLWLCCLYRCCYLRWNCRAFNRIWRNFEELGHLLFLFRRNYLGRYIVLYSWRCLCLEGWHLHLEWLCFLWRWCLGLGIPLVGRGRGHHRHLHYCFRRDYFLFSCFEPFWRIGRPLLSFHICFLWINCLILIRFLFLLIRKPIKRENSLLNILIIYLSLLLLLY